MNQHCISYYDLAHDRARVVGDDCPTVRAICANRVLLVACVAPRRCATAVSSLVVATEAGTVVARELPEGEGLSFQSVSVTSIVSNSPSLTPDRLRGIYISTEEIFI